MCLAASESKHQVLSSYAREKTKKILQLKPIKKVGQKIIISVLLVNTRGCAAPPVALPQGRRDDVMAARYSTVGFVWLQAANGTLPADL